MQSTNEFPLENNGDYTTRVRFITNDAGGRFIEIRQRVKPEPEQYDAFIVLTKEQFHEAIRHAIGPLFPMNAVDEVMMTRHITDHMLASIRDSERSLIDIAAGKKPIPTVKTEPWLSQLVRSCITIAILSLRSIQSPVQGDGR